MNHWFLKKKLGYGWSFPVTWQGWATVIGYLALLAVDRSFFPPAQHPIAFYVGVAILTSLLVLIVSRKGEPLDRQ